MQQHCNHSLTPFILPTKKEKHLQELNLKVIDAHMIVEKDTFLKDTVMRPKSHLYLLPGASGLKPYSQTLCGQSGLIHKARKLQSVKFLPPNYGLYVKSTARRKKGNSSKACHLSRITNELKLLSSDD